MVVAACLLEKGEGGVYIGGCISALRKKQLQQHCPQTGKVFVKSSCRDSRDGLLLISNQGNRVEL